MIITNPILDFPKKRSLMLSWINATIIYQLILH